MPPSIIVDGASHGNPGPASIGVVIKDGHGGETRISRSIGRGTNNEAEYTALITGMEKALELGLAGCTIFMDSELVEKHLKGQYRVKSPTLLPLYLKARRLLAGGKFKLVHVGEPVNHEAHLLAQAALKKKPS